MSEDKQARTGIGIAIGAGVGVGVALGAAFGNVGRHDVRRGDRNPVAVALVLTR